MFFSLDFKKKAIGFINSFSLSMACVYYTQSDVWNDGSWQVGILKVRLLLNVLNEQDLPNFDWTEPNKKLLQVRKILFYLFEFNMHSEYSVLFSQILS